MRTVITGGGFLVVTALCVLIHCSIISTNMRDNEVSNSLDKASDYAVDVMGDIYLRLDYSQGNTAAYMQELIQGFCRAVNEKIGTDGELSVQVVKADIENGNFDIIVTEDYDYPLRGKKERVVQFLRHLHPDIVLQRLVGRAPEDNTLFTNWSMGWWRVQDLIDDMMDELDAHQGDLCDYLNGKAVRKFIDGGQA